MNISVTLCLFLKSTVTPTAKSTNRLLFSLEFQSKNTLIIKGAHLLEILPQKLWTTMWLKAILHWNGI